MRIRLACVCLVACVASGSTWGRASAPSAPAPLQTYFAGMHNHTGYSDGVPQTTPATAYAKARSWAADPLDIMTVTEHSESFEVPMTFSEQCLNAQIARCALADGVNSFRKWDANGEQAAAATVDGQFVAGRGFEWTSDVEDHANVYFSASYTNAKRDGGYATIETFWRWVRENRDALVTFNHPGDKTTEPLAPGPFDDFRYVPDLDRRVVGIEVFNGGKDKDGNFKDYTTRGGTNWIARTLNTGWHVGLIGAQDSHTDDWGDPAQYARTAFLMPSLTPDAMREAMLARRFYATRDANLRVSFGTSNGDPMGARLRKPVGTRVTLTVSAADPNATDAISKIEIFGSPDPNPANPDDPAVRDSWKLVAAVSGASSLAATVASTYGEKWYLARITQTDGEKAYTSPIWIGASTHPYGDWLAGDLHVHTQNGHDTCLSADPTMKYDGTRCQEPWTWSFSPAERIALAKERGLDFLAITDHNNLLSQHDAAYVEEAATGSLALVPAYENSLPGHAQMLGARHCFGATRTSTPDDDAIIVDYKPHDECWNPDTSVAGVRAEMDALRAEGGIFQINHPGDGDWIGRYDKDGDGDGKNDLLEMVPDSVEVWNIGPWEYQPPFPASGDNDAALAFWERFLNAGYQVAATGGSDSHWRLTSAVQGVGQPTTWVYSADGTYGNVLRGIHDGHTFVSHQPPAYGAPRLYLEADADRNGSFESMQGDTVPLGTRVRVRVEGAPPGSFVRVRSGGAGGNGDETEIYPFADAPFSNGARWIRAELLAPQDPDAREANCDPVIGAETTYCRNRLVVLALTSPIYQKAA